ncbi:hypothetical protein OHB49_43185 (plasmid) [Streptomyces sp. NBC_01717]|uniref:hypothetical protein n=1 Tax=Streptomyces sp. NBC_01717 TaxID=2975918 RepID=UPI002E31BBED|nr:hypothetical protein [Streptomyces sp. NBC_01717]
MSAVDPHRIRRVQHTRLVDERVVVQRRPQEKLVMQPQTRRTHHNLRTGGQRTTDTSHPKILPTEPGLPVKYPPLKPHGKRLSLTLVHKSERNLRALFQPAVVLEMLRDKLPVHLGQRTAEQPGEEPHERRPADVDPVEALPLPIRIVRHRHRQELREERRERLLKRLQHSRERRRHSTPHPLHDQNDLQSSARPHRHRLKQRRPTREHRQQRDQRQLKIHERELDQNLVLGLGQLPRTIDLPIARLLQLIRHPVQIIHTVVVDEQLHRPDELLRHRRGHRNPHLRDRTLHRSRQPPQVIRQLLIRQPAVIAQVLIPRRHTGAHPNLKKLPEARRELNRHIRLSLC